MVGTMNEWRHLIRVKRERGLDKDEARRLAEIRGDELARRVMHSRNRPLREFGAAVSAPFEAALDWLVTRMEGRLK